MDEPFDRLYLKEIDKPPVKLEWFFYSFITSTSPDSIVVHRNDRTATVCFSDNVAALELEDNNIVVGFYGKPTLYMQPVVLPKSILGCNVIIDTTYKGSSGSVRKCYRK